MLEREGYRPNVGIILVNNRNEVFRASVSGNMLAVPAGRHQYGVILSHVSRAHEEWA